MKPKLASTIILVAASLAVVFTDPAADKGKEKGNSQNVLPLLPLNVRVCRGS